MATGLLIAAAVIVGYLALTICCGVLISKMEDERRKKNAQSIFIGFNAVLLCSAMTYAYISFL